MRAILAAALALFGATSPLAPRAVARTVVVHGVVTDVAGRPLSQAAVGVVGTPFQVMSDTSGRYAFKFPVEGQDSVLMQARRIGYNTTKRFVRLAGDSVRADFSLEASTLRLEEVVVTSGISVRGAQSLGASFAEPHLDRERYARIEETGFLSAA